MPRLLPAELKRFPLLCLLIVSLFVVLAFAALLEPQYWFRRSVYVPLHTAMHMFSLVVAWLVFALGWNTHDSERAGSTTLLACGFLGVALLDFGHALSYPGMPDFATPSSVEKAINFSIESRLLAALALLAIAFLPKRRLTRPGAPYAYLAVTLAAVALAYWTALFRPDILPRTYEPSAGLTGFKIGAEYVIVVLHVIAAIGFQRQLASAGSPNAAYLFTASIAMALSQTLNTMYSHPYDLYNFLSHAYRVIAYMLIYRGLFISEIREPYILAERLQEELRGSATRLREMGARMQQDIEEERKRISQSLHDEMGQNLTALQLDAEWIRSHCKADQTTLETVDRMQKTIEESAASMRRIVADLRPRVLDDLGIVAAIEALVSDTSARSGLEITFLADGHFDDMGETAKTALYRIAQECLTNVTRHAQATKVHAELNARSDEIELAVADNGRGFSPQKSPRPGSFGLFGMAERAIRFAGNVTVESAPEKGTRVRVRLPLQPATVGRRKGDYLPVEQRALP